MMRAGPAPVDPSSGSETGRKAAPGLFLMTDSLEVGGSERQFAALARVLDRTALRLHLGCIRRSGELGEGLGEIPQFRLGGSLYGFRSLVTRCRLARHLRRHGIAIAHAFDFYTNLTLIPAARFAGVSVVIGSQRQLGDLLTPAQARVQALAFRWCDSIVCNSRAAAERLIERGISERKLAVIGNGLPPEAFTAATAALPRCPGVLRVGMIAGMRSRSKNHAGLLRAAAMLSNRIQNLEFVLVGDGPLRAELERNAANLGLSGQVRFLGERRDIPSLLASMDVTALPSVSEGMSNAILESMAAGVPVVAARAGGTPELVVDGTGLLVAPNDDEALAAALGDLLSDHALRQRLGQNARRFALDNFTLDYMCQRHEDLYRDLLELKGWRPRPRPTPAARADEQRLKVAIVAPSLRYVGGQSVQADLMVRCWQQDTAVEAWPIYVDPPLPRGLRWMERIPFLRTLVREPIYLTALWRGLRDCDIVHIFSASYWSFLVAPAPALVVARLRGRKTLINYHSGEARDHLRRFRTALPILRRADQVLVPSEYLVNVFREFNLETRVVPNIVDLDQFPFRLREPLRPRLVCTRGFHPYYAVDVVVRAFAEVKRASPDATLCLAGKGPSEEEIRRLVRELGLEGVKFAGVLSRQEIGHVYDEADIFINASWLDNMPISILEAFACGTPVVSTAPEGIRFMVEHDCTGLLSDPGDWRALAANVTRLLSDPELALRLAINAHRQSKRYQWGSVREQWVEVYRSLVPAKVQVHDGRPLVDNEISGPAAGTVSNDRQESIAGSRRL
ncbi:MAG TPA: glycosyltransferase [Terriglobia bacterium]|nr:glycosyltransferase [Terriglobia bacterium]